jgi:HEAT repeat protein
LGLQALGFLVQTAGVDEQTSMAVLREALQDPDPAFNTYAMQELAGRGNADAMAALHEALHSTDPSIRLMVLESVVHTEAGLPLLRTALADADKTVRDAAATLLKQAEAGTDAAGKP